MCGRRQGSNNGELLHMYMLGEWVPDVTEAKSCVSVEVLVPSDEQGFFDFSWPESSSVNSTSLWSNAIR